MTTTVKMVEDSISAAGIRLSTMLLRYPRFIHAELMTHRVFSRNASSSRAIPVRKLIEDIRRDPAMPIHWGMNQPGMQAREQLTGWRLWAVKKLWMLGMWIMTTIALLASRIGAHKQIVNRMVEPWSHINVVVTSTEWDNFWELRCHPDAQPEMHELAVRMKEVFDASIPKQLVPGEWHLPFVTPEERRKFDLNTLLAASTARCARTSYLTHAMGVPVISKDTGLHDKLVASVPIHASPAEHQATPDTVKPANDNSNTVVWENPEKHGNLRGFIQYRKVVEERMAA